MVRGEGERDGPERGDATDIWGGFWQWMIQLPINLIRRLLNKPHKQNLQ